MENSKFSLALWNGEFIGIENIHIPITNRAFRYGDALFETMRFVFEKQCIPLWPFHLERLLQGASLLEFDLPDAQILETQLLELALQSNPKEDIKIRLSMMRSGGGTYFPETTHCDYFAEVGPISLPKALNMGIIKDFPKYPGPLNQVKTASSGFYVMAATKIAKLGWNEGIILTPEGYICESVQCNIWWEQNGKWQTPHLHTGCVNGSVRRFVFSNSNQIEEVFETIEVLEKASAIVLSNGLHGITFLTSWKGRTLTQTNFPVRLPWN